MISGNLCHFFPEGSQYILAKHCRFLYTSKILQLWKSANHEQEGIPTIISLEQNPDKSQNWISPQSSVVAALFHVEIFT